MLFRALVLVLLFTSITCAEELTLEKAIENTLKLQADIITSKLDSDASKSAYAGAGGAFDHVLSSNAEIASAETPLGAIEKQTYNSDKLTSDTETYAVKLSKLTRSGISVETSASVFRQNDAPYNQPTQATSSIGVAINIPLFDLLMENKNSTNEKIALENSHARVDDYFFQASTSVYQTIAAYWNYLAAYERLLVYKKSEENIQKMLSDFEKLVEAKERPRADANQIRANLAMKQGLVVSGERDLSTLGYQLATSMGVSIDETTLSPPKVQWVTVDDPRTLSADSYIRNAYKNRFDIKSLERVVHSAELILDMARRGMKPDLDVYVSADYSDKGRDVSADVVSNARTVKAGILFSTPLERNFGKSDVAQKEIALRQWTINFANAKRKAALDVTSSLNELKQNLKAYEFSVETVNLYQEALTVEEKKLKLGMSTVIDVINTRENYQNALIAKIEGLRLVAVSLAGVAYSSGGMITADGDKIRVNLSGLYSLNTK